MHITLTTWFHPLFASSRFVRREGLMRCTAMMGPPQVHWSHPCYARRSKAYRGWDQCTCGGPIIAVQCTKGTKWWGEEMKWWGARRTKRGCIFSSPFHSMTLRPSGVPFGGAVEFFYRIFFAPKGFAKRTQVHLLLRSHPGRTQDAPALHNAPLVPSFAEGYWARMHL